MSDERSPDEQTHESPEQQTQPEEPTQPLAGWQPEGRAYGSNGMISGPPPSPQ